VNSQLGPYPHVDERDVRLPWDQLIHNRLKLCARVVPTAATVRSARVCLREYFCDQSGEKAASNLVEVGVRNSSIVVLVVHGPAPAVGAVRRLCEGTMPGSDGAYSEAGHTTKSGHCRFHNRPLTIKTG
jgi:hypothetical protein